MVINDKEYALSSNNFVSEETIKSKIVLLNTFNSGMNHYVGWHNRIGGEYKRTTTYTIDKFGTVYQHFNPKYYSRLLDKKVDREIISISLVNYGYLIKDTKKNLYLNWFSDIYSNEDVFEKRWRGYKYWEPYSNEQFTSAIELINKLCLEYNINKKVLSHNTKIDFPNNHNGVMYRSNFDKHYSDLSPAWDFMLFKEIIENEKNKQLK